MLNTISNTYLLNQVYKAQIFGRWENIYSFNNPGYLFAWGRNSYGELGTNDTNSYNTPTQIGNSFWLKCSTGYGYTLAIDSNSNLWSWGQNDQGQLGTQDNVNYSSPMQIPGTWKTVSSSDTKYVLAIDSNNNLWAWGSNTYGQLGTVDTFNYSSPMQIPGKWLQASAGGIISSSSALVGWSLALDTSGQLWGFGRDFGCMVGTTSVINYSSPVKIGSNVWSNISYNGYFGAFLTQKSDNSIWFLGASSYGSNALNSATFNYSSPVQVVGNWLQVSVAPASFLSGSGSKSQEHTLLINTSNQLFGAGLNTAGELGQGNFTGSYSSPVQIGTSNKWLYSFTGQRSSFIIDSSYHIWSCGNNNYGQLGTGDTNNKKSLVQIQGLWLYGSSSGFHTTGILLP